MNAPLFLCYAKCATCRKARKWIDAQGITVEARDIVADKPTEEELRAWHKASGLPLKKFFNTSGKKYKELSLKDKVPGMSEDEQYKLLATDGLLVKRPILVDGDSVLVGFKEPAWQERLCGEAPATSSAPAGASAPDPTPPKKTAHKEAQPRNNIAIRAYQLKITLRGMKPAVWRRCFVPEDMTFQDLADVLIRVMGWNGSHLSAFEMPKSGLNLMTNPWSDDEEQFGERNGRNVRLADLLPKEDHFIFVYDMGDNWEHEVVVEKVRDDYPALQAVVLQYEGDCPPDDSGGVWGYMELLASDDPDDKEWLKQAKPYDMTAANAALKELVK